MKTLLVAGALALGFTSQVAPPAASPDISGTWDMTVSTTRGLELATLTLKKSGDAFTGLASRQTEQASVEAKLKDKAVTIVITTKTQSGPSTVTLTGEVDGETMGGTGEFGARGTGQWSAKRRFTGESADVNGTWVLELVTPKGTEAPIVMLKQNGEKLSGNYGGALGHTRVDGTIKGNAIEFWIDLSIDGKGARVTYSGTVDKDAMKGTVKLGALGDGTFKGTRKQ